MIASSMLVRSSGTLSPLLPSRGKESASKENVSYARRVALAVPFLVPVLDTVCRLELLKSAPAANGKRIDIVRVEAHLDHDARRRASRGLDQHGTSVLAVGCFVCTRVRMAHGGRAPGNQLNRRAHAQAPDDVIFMVASAHVIVGCFLFVALLWFLLMPQSVSSPCAVIP